MNFEFQPSNGKRSLVIRSMEKLLMLLVLNYLWVLCSAPLITLIPASAALCYAVSKTVRRGRGALFQSFFSSLKINLKQGVILSLVVLCVFGLLFVDLVFLYRRSAGNYSVLYLLILLLAVIPTALALPYLAPCLARYEGTVAGHMKNALMLSLRHLPWSLLMALLLYASVCAVLFFPDLLFIIPSFIALAIVRITDWIFRRYLKDGDLDGVEDPWFLE